MLEWEIIKMSQSQSQSPPSPLLCENCQRGIHHELQIVENCACPCSNAVRDEHTIMWKWSNRRIA